MGIFSNIFKKKSNSVDSGIAVLPASQPCCLGDAEQMAYVIAAGLESENFSGMNQQLANMMPGQQERTEYVFDHPGVVGTFFALTLCVIATIVYFYFLFIGSLTSYFSEELFSVGAVFAGGSLAILFVNICLISRLVSTIKHKTRFDVYIEILGFKSLEYVEDLALCSKQKEPKVIKDLNRAIKQKLIPQGHFSRDNLVFMVSDKVYDKYMEKPAVYDRYFQKQLENRHRERSRTKRISQIMNTGEQYIKKLNDFKVLVKNKTVSRKIERLSNVASMIFHEIDVNPEQVNSLGVFLNYYLPTTEKLLETYVSITEKKISVPNLSVAKKEIEDSLNTIIHSYEVILEKLYEEYEMDNISSDIAAMELVMKKEGLEV